MRRRSEGATRLQAWVQPNPCLRLSPPYSWISREVHPANPVRSAWAVLASSIAPVEHAGGGGRLLGRTEELSHCLIEPGRAVEEHTEQFIFPWGERTHQAGLNSVSSC